LVTPQTDFDVSLCISSRCYICVIKFIHRLSDPPRRKPLARRPCHQARSKARSTHQAPRQSRSSWPQPILRRSKIMDQRTHEDRNQG
jgi:hypothetical protein